MEIKQKGIDIILECISLALYIRVSDNVVADALTGSVSSTSIDPVDLHAIVRLQATDEELHKHKPKLSAFSFYKDLQTCFDTSTPHTLPILHKQS